MNVFSACSVYWECGAVNSRPFGNDAYGHVPQGDLALPLEGVTLLFFFLTAMICLNLKLMLISSLQLMIPLLMLSLSSNRDPQ